MASRRKFPRVSEQWQLTYRVLSSAQFQESAVASLARNISGDGICFTSREPLDAGAMVVLDMKSHEFDRPLLALAKVVWCKSLGDESGHDVGATFWWVGWKDSDAQSSITDYLRDKAYKESE